MREHLKTQIDGINESQSVIEERVGVVEEDLKITQSIIEERIYKTAEAAVCCAIEGLEIEMATLKHNWKE